MDIQVTINQMAVIFIIMAVGYVIGKAKLLTSEGNKILSRIVLFVAVPCTILFSVLTGNMDVSVEDTVMFLLFSMLTFAIAFAISIPAVRLMGGDKANHGLFNYITVFSNSVFMGFPVIIAIFGIEAAFYLALFSVVFNALTFSVGIFMISGKGTTFDPKRLINSTLITALIAIPLAITGFRAPSVVTEAIGFIGSMTTPGAMLVIGASLAHAKVKDVLSEWRIIPITVLKLVVVPVVTWLILRMIIADELMLGVLVVLAAMPTAAMAAMLAVEYKGNERAASAGVLLTTLLCCVTVPVLVYFLFAG